MHGNITNLHRAIAALDAYWAPQTIADLGNMRINIAKLKGRYEAHRHDDEEKFFQVIYGTLSIEFPDNIQQVQAGECIIIPKGITHTPFAEEETGVVFFVPA